MKSKLAERCFIYSTAALLMTAISFNLSADAKSVPKPFQGQDQNSILSISYEDYSSLLKLSVVEFGLSTRDEVPPSRAESGSHIKPRLKHKTALEGNRFLFEIYEVEVNKAHITKIRKSLEQLPDEMPLSSFNCDEQLAYWLNLYNISLIEQLIEVYPVYNLENLLYNDGILDRKFLNVSGVPLSLNDIHDTIIIGKFGKQPTVMYGLFQGIIGGPNIRTSAFTGDSVMTQLDNNAVEFINSNRGTYKARNSRFKVSSFYQRNRQLFPNFDEDLKKHLGHYIDSEYADYLENADEMRPYIKDTSVANLLGGARKSSSPFSTNNSVDFVTAMRDRDPNAVESVMMRTRGHAPYTVRILAKMKEKYNTYRGEVIITEGDKKLNNNK